MKRSRFIRLTAMACCSLFLVLQSCKKDKDDPAPQTGGQGNTTFTSASELLRSWAPGKETFTIDAGNGGTINAGKGIHLQIPPGALKSAAGVVSGNVTVSLTGIISKKDMMTSGVFSVAKDGGMLESGGMFNLEIRQNGELLSVDPGKPLTFKIDDPTGAAKTDMGLFDADSTSKDTVKWVRVPQGKVSPDSANEGYVFQWWNMGYCNIDRYMDPSNCSNQFKAVLPAGMDAAKTSIMLVFSDYHAEASTYYSSANGGFVTPYCLPIGKNIKVVCVTIKDKNLYYSITNAVVSAGLTVNVTDGTLISEAALETLLEGL